MHPGACFQEGGLDRDVIKRDALKGAVTGKTTLQGRGGVSFLPYSLSGASGLSATWTPLSPRKLLTSVSGDLSPAGQKGLASSPKHLQGQVTRSRRGPPETFCCTGIGGSRPRGEALGGKDMPCLPTPEMSVSGTQWDCHRNES